MKSTLKKVTSGLLSAGMLLTMMQPVLTASTVAAAASAADECGPAAALPPAGRRL